MTGHPTPLAGEALQRAEALLDLQRWEQASAVLSNFLAGNPRDPEGWALLATAHLGAGAADRALAAARTAASLDPHNEWPLRLMSVAFAQLGRHDEAHAAARDAVRRAPEVWITHAQLASVAGSSRRRRREAESAARRAVDLAPTQPHAHLVLAAVLSASGRGTEATAAVERALALDPTCADAHHELARANLARHRPAGPVALARAAGGFAEAVTLDPRAEFSRHSVDAVLRIFLHRLAYFCVISAMIVYQVSTHAGQVPRAVPLLLPLVPTVFAVRFLRALPAIPRRLLFHQACTRPLVAPTFLTTLSLLLLGSSGLVAAGDRATLNGIAGCMALWSAIHFSFEARQSARAAHGLPPVHALSSGSLILIAVALALTGVTILGGAQERIAGVIGGTICGAIAAQLIRIVVRRRRHSRRP